MDILFKTEKLRRKKPNYCTQHDYYSCGPTAILNALKWVGIPAATVKKSHRFLCDICYTTGKGTFPQEIDRVLRFLAPIHDFSVVRLKNPNIRSITRELIRPDRSIIFNYYRHYSFWPTTDGTWYFGVNDHCDDGRRDACMIRVSALPRKEFKKYLRKSCPDWRPDWRPDDYCYPQVWVITRHE